MMTTTLTEFVSREVEEKLFYDSLAPLVHLGLLETLWMKLSTHEPTTKQSEMLLSIVLDTLERDINGC